jgi:hypothetical protein
MFCVIKSLIVGMICAMRLRACVFIWRQVVNILDFSKRTRCALIWPKVVNFFVFFCDA